MHAKPDLRVELVHNDHFFRLGDLGRYATQEISMAFRAIGSSYLVRQVAGSERLGGLRVTIYPRSDNLGEVNVELTDWHSGEIHEYPLPEMAAVAEQSIRKFADAYSFDLQQLDIKLDRFIFHDVDSDPRCYEQAARSAFKSALESLYSRDDPLGSRKQT